MKQALLTLPNIGDNLAAALLGADIDSPEALRQLGSREAFLRLREKDPGACLSRLQALEGAIQGIRWHFLPEETKADLRAFYQALR